MVLNIGSLCGSAAFEKVFLLYTPTTYETADIIAKTTLTSEVLGNRTVPATAGSWKWEKLRDINFFLQYSSNCADEHVRLEYEGVARFFRAWFYFEKVKHYGDVPWVETIQKMAAMGVSTVAECGPGKVLAGLNKRCVKGINTHSLETPEAFAAVRAALA